MSDLPLSNFLLSQDLRQIFMSFKPFFRTNDETNLPGNLLKSLLELQGREKLLAEVVQHTPECVKLITSEGSLLDMNPAGLSLIEAEDFQSVQGANVYDLIAPEHLDAFKQFNARVCSGKKESLEFEIIALKGTRRWMFTTAVPFELPTGESVHLAITREITKEKEHQLEIEQARQKAEAANRAKSEFLANMSHEIRTPMTAILGFSDILLESVHKKEHIEAVKTIQFNGNYLLELINDILDLSKIESGNMIVEKISCSPVRILTEVASLMRMRALSKGIDLKFLFEGEIPETIESDSTRIRQVLINLIGNAIKFTEKGSVVVKTTLQDRDENPHLKIEVIDTGIGIAAEKLEKIFSPFTQADNSTTRKFGGTGLGLAICKRLGKALGGNIKVQSRPGQGSTFVFTLATGSLADVSMCQETNEVLIASHNKQDTNQKSPSLNGIRVLLVEDGPDNQRLIKHIIQKAGAYVEVVENGQIAIDLIDSVANRDKQFDVILMDMQMPVLDGYSATRKLRENNYNLPIIALTAHAMSDDRKKCLAAGCDNYCTKPIDRFNLLTMISQYALIADSCESLID